MSRWAVIILSALALATLGGILIQSRKGGEHFFMRDFRLARGYVSEIRAIENHCYAIHGRYLSLPELSRDACGNLTPVIMRAQKDGYYFEIDAAGSQYALQVRPASPERQVSLYSDQDGKTRIGTRLRPATRDSLLLDERP